MNILHRLLRITGWEKKRKAVLYGLQSHTAILKSLIFIEKGGEGEEILCITFVYREPSHKNSENTNLSLERRNIPEAKTFTSSIGTPQGGSLDPVYSENALGKISKHKRPMIIWSLLTQMTQTL